MEEQMVDPLQRRHLQINSCRVLTGKAPTIVMVYAGDIGINEKEARVCYQKDNDAPLPLRRGMKKES
jgi:hypothetical protein